MPFKKVIYNIIILFLFHQNAYSHTDKYRCMWREDPATTMVIGWNQVSGSNAVVYFDTENFQHSLTQYRFSKKPERVVHAKSMNNHFVRLRNLTPNTVYYFIIKDSEGLSRCMSFKTAPDNPDTKLSIIAGGDSRNNREIRISANQLVGKLRPHCVFFGGDMTESSFDNEWVRWFDDWQNSISHDGRITPIIVARGNHEYSNQTLIDLFDVAAENVYYALTFGGNLLRAYTLNSMIASGGNQRKWLESDLMKNHNVIWKMAQYHHTIRPHTREKEEKHDLIVNWATLFFKYQLKLVVESDAHVVKSTFPIRPSTELGSHEGFIRDDARGTTYVGEGCWGAPLRRNDDNKPWTRNSGSFNQFKWIFVDKDKLEIRTVKTGNAQNVAAVDPNNIFKIPAGLNIWDPSNGKVITVTKFDASSLKENLGEELASRSPMQILNFAAKQANKDVLVKWDVQFEPSHMTYEIQRAVDNQEYKTIGTLKGKCPRGKGDYSYEYIDKEIGTSAAGKYVGYRIKRIYKDGKAKIFTPNVDKQNIASAPRYSTNSESKTKPSLPKSNKLIPDAKGILNVKYKLTKAGSVSVHLMNLHKKEVLQQIFRGQLPNDYLKKINVNSVPKGRYILVVKANQKVIKKYQVVKR